MSTEHQQVSLDNQADAIHRYAGRKGFTVVQTYSDGVGVDRVSRIGLHCGSLLSDVSNGSPMYRAVLAPTHFLHDAS